MKQITSNEQITIILAVDIDIHYSVWLKSFCLEIPT